VSRRAEITLAPDDQRELIESERIVVVSSIGVRGWPHSMPLWYVPRDTGIWIYTYAKSQKVKNLERDPRATLQVEDGELYHELRGVMMECDVEIEREPRKVATYGIALFERFVPVDDNVTAMVEGQAPKRIGLTFHPTRIVSWDHGKLGGAY
jgi:hypothetical protein